MKEIKAFVHKNRISAVIEAIRAANILPEGHSDDALNINVATVQSLLKAVDAAVIRVWHILVAMAFGIEGPEQSQFFLPLFLQVEYNQKKQKNLYF